MGAEVYQEDDLTGFRQDDYYPLVIGIETVFPDKYKGRAKRSIEYTFGTFYSESSSASLKYKQLA